MISAAMNTPSIVNATAIFTAVPTSSPSQVATPTFPARNASRWARNSPIAPQPGHDAGNSAKRSADDSGSAGADALRRQRSRRIVDCDAYQRQHGQHADDPAGNTLEVVDPGCQQHAAEDQRNSRKGRQHGAGDSCHDQQHGKHPQCCGHALLSAQRQ
jgi:hypothetical protein